MNNHAVENKENDMTDFEETVALLLYNFGVLCAALVSATLLTLHGHSWMSSFALVTGLLFSATTSRIKK